MERKREKQSERAGKARKVFIGAWVSVSFARRLDHVAACMGFAGREEFVRYLLRFGIEAAT